MVTKLQPVSDLSVTVLFMVRSIAFWALVFAGSAFGVPFLAALTLVGWNSLDGSIVCGVVGALLAIPAMGVGGVVGLLVKRRPKSRRTVLVAGALVGLLAGGFIGLNFGEGSFPVGPPMPYGLALLMLLSAGFAPIAGLLVGPLIGGIAGAAFAAVFAEPLEPLKPET